MKKEGFFGTDNLHRAGWAAIVGVSGFMGVALYHYFFGAQKVVIEKSITELSSSNISHSSNVEISELAKAVKQLSEATLKNSDKKRIRELSDEVDRLRKEVAKPDSPMVSSNPEAGVKSGEESSTAEAMFELPSHVEGYIPTKLIGAINSTCPSKTVSAGSTVTATLYINDQSLITKASPFRVSIVLIRNSSEFVQIDEKWQEMHYGENALSLEAILPPGKYQFEYGFYVRSKLSGKYPPFYSKQCTFTVPKT